MKALVSSRLTMLAIIGSLALMISAAAMFPRHFEHAAEMPSVDSVHVLASALGLSVPPRYPVTLIKVDDRTQADWGNPYPVAKEKLAQVVEAVRALKPAAIIVDFDLSVERDKADTDAFNTMISSWSKSDPPLLLPVELTVLADGTVERKATVVASPPAGTPVFWTSVLFRKDRDLKVREWRLWEHSRGTNEIFLSPQLTVSALLEGGAEEVETITRRIHESLAPQSTAHHEPVSLSGWLVDAKVVSPVNYVFGRTGQPHRDASGQAMLAEWSATDVLNKGIAATAIAGRTVIIGASRADSGDNHATPIGQMEGMRILANAISTGPDVFGTRTPSGFETLLVSLFFAGFSVALLKRVKVVFSGTLILIGAILFYALIARLYGPAGANGALSWGITLIGVFFVLESTILFLFELLQERRGWHAFLNRK